LDEAGQKIEGLIPVATVWSAVEPLRGREFFSAQAVNSEVTTRIRIRYRPGIDRTMFFLCQGVEFEILYTINPNFENKELQLMSRERQ
jgi:SPP1 family predicted phage head-tail adaptor